MIKKIHHLIIWSILIIGSQSLKAQDIDYAWEVVKKLCAEDMYGRGYVNKGERIAADYIANEFRTIGLQKYTENYFQPFTIPVGTLYGNIKLKLDKKELKVGHDFILHASSPTTKGKYKIAQFPLAAYKQPEMWRNYLPTTANKFLVLPNTKDKSLTKEQKERVSKNIAYLLYHPASKVKGVIILEDELTWYGNNEELKFPYINVKKEFFDKKVKNITIDIEGKYHKNYPTQNVIGYVEGTKYPDSLIVFTAHYDHLGMMGRDLYFPGANDNASGTAMILNLAKHYAANPPECTIVFIAFGSEEIMLLGSQHFVKSPLFPLKNINFLVNLDILGTGSEGVTVVNGAVFHDKFKLIKQLNAVGDYLKKVQRRGEACNSDQCAFYQKGVPCFYIYTMGGSQAYHDIEDTVENLTLIEFEDVFRLLRDFADTLSTK